MHLGRRLSLWFVTALLFTSLSLFVYSWVFLSTFADRQVVKSWLEDSGAYENVVSEIIAVSVAQAEEEAVSVDVDTLADAANAAFPPNLLQTSAERFFDGTYDWLEGSNEAFQFSIDLANAKVVFAERLTSAASNRLSNLPACSSGGFPTEIDPFTIECLPRGYDFSQAADEFADSIANDENFLPNPVITEADIQLRRPGGEVQSVTEALSVVPTAYQIARVGVFVFASIAFFCIAGIFLLQSTAGRSTFRLFRAFLVTAISIGIFTFISSQSTGWLESAFGADEASQGFARRVVLPIVQEAADDITRVTFNFTLAYAAIAGALLLLVMYLRRQRQQPKAAKPKKTDKRAKRSEKSFFEKDDTIAVIAEKARLRQHKHRKRRKPPAKKKLSKSQSKSKKKKAS